MNTETDYVLGTHDEEIARLGIQHQVWRPYMLDAWSRAGITRLKVHTASEHRINPMIPTYGRL